MFTDKIALVTGASRGIGREVALQLARNGAFVIVNYNGSEEAAKSVLNEIVSIGGKAEIYKCNVGSFNDVKTMIDYIIKQYKKIDILINNAGITRDNLLIKMSESEFDDVLNINLKGAFNTSKHVIKYMIKQRSGKIVNISSVVGLTGNVGQVNYCSSKAGIIGMTKSLAKEVASRGINVNAIAPGFIETDMSNELSEDVINSIMNSIPMKKIGQPGDIADAVIFLSSEQSKYITGQTLEVNGGMNM
ncbi:3-oxoacyl-[acyl-carrier-protein] reductase [Anaeromicropila populeti]|uniref:3-oxoacyl-[acyl-carrier-protein] reductase n=1 Tax=Anaeromicropila populeti TaxID=37658 RepID=A0A1I6LAM2_9FIRM|nr:3-oxoacyl-[acyl-carrier-protein] reductase [Anaeromicropila populeti]SFS00464.1 3-oxoacyl-[acyl-carrier-protein] reductase [Anaeromicropila populeti]